MTLRSWRGGNSGRPLSIAICTALPNTVTASLVGRLDGVKDAGVVRDSTGKFVGANGYGNLNLFNSHAC